MEPSNEERVFRRLIELVSIDTTSGWEDAGLDVLKVQLSEVGLEVTTHEGAPGRTNVFAGPHQPRVIFTTHLDVVPHYFSPVSQSKSAEEGGDVVHGRGACDAKGQIVCQLEAIRRLRESGRDDVAFVGVVGEESDAIGAAAIEVWQERLEKVELLVNGEPTQGVCATGQRGYLHLRLTCTGRSAHSGSPELGHSAINDLLDWLQTLREQEVPVDEDLGPEVWNIGVLEGGSAANVVPHIAHAELLARTLPDSDFLSRVEASCPDTGNIEVLVNEAAARYPRIEGFEYATMPFGSDLPTLARFLPDTAQVALVGPGDIAVAHTEDEHIRLDELLEGAELLRSLAEKASGKRK